MGVVIGFVALVVALLLIGALWNWWIGATPSESEEHDP